MTSAAFLLLSILMAIVADSKASGILWGANIGWAAARLLDSYYEWRGAPKVQD